MLESLGGTTERPGMAPKLGYLLPTREQIMEGKPDAASLLALATRAEAEGFESIWVAIC